ncbi:MAG TPA: M24 family metallopeptidase [Planctomycetota bacterium]|nr:M24 family metallopeptidase [Planctomycetota bacterium]
MSRVRDAKPAVACALLLLSAAASAAPPTRDDAVAARRERRTALAARLGTGYALVLGQPLTDVLQPPQEGHLLYLAGVDDPGAVLVLAGADAPPLVLRRGTAAVEAREALFLLEAGDAFAQFVGLSWRPGADAERALGIEATRPAPGSGEALGAELASVLPEGACLHVPAYAGRDLAGVREVRDDAVRKLRAMRPDMTFPDLHPALMLMRSTKEPREVEAMRRAAEATIGAFRDALAEIRPGSSEAAVDGALLAGVRRRGAMPAYRFVVGSGPRSTIPHWFRNDGPLAAGDLLVIDAGGSVDRYATDITRTFPVSGRFSPRQREVYDAVLAAQLAGIAAVKPGATLQQVDAAARGVLKKAGLDRYFLHGTCHHVGLDVHDPGPPLLAAGMTITVEPGVYIREEALGIRIEDVVLVTEDGADVLSRNLPKDPGEIERLLGEPGLSGR